MGGSEYLAALQCDGAGQCDRIVDLTGSSIRDSQGVASRKCTRVLIAQHSNSISQVGNDQFESLAVAASLDEGDTEVAGDRKSGGMVHAKDCTATLEGLREQLGCPHVVTRPEGSRSVIIAASKIVYLQERNFFVGD
jgi:hypothetical protein